MQRGVEIERIGADVLERLPKVDPGGVDDDIDGKIMGLCGSRCDFRCLLRGKIDNN
jgi:hypothetical protein